MDNQVPVQYFQVVAAVIPTLLVAIVIGRRHGETVALSLTDMNRVAAGALVLLVASAGTIVLAAEVISLKVLASGGAVYQGVTLLTDSAVFILFSVVLLEMLYPTLEKYSTNAVLVFGSFFVLGVLGVTFLAREWYVSTTFPDL